MSLLAEKMNLPELPTSMFAQARLLNGQPGQEAQRSPRSTIRGLDSLSSFSHLPPHSSLPLRDKTKQENRKEKRERGGKTRFAFFIVVHVKILWAPWAAALFASLSPGAQAHTKANIAEMLPRGHARSKVILGRPLKVKCTRCPRMRPNLGGVMV